MNLLYERSPIKVTIFTMNLCIFRLWKTMYNVKRHIFAHLYLSMWSKLGHVMKNFLCSISYLSLYLYSSFVFHRRAIVVNKEEQTGTKVSPTLRNLRILRHGWFTKSADFLLACKRNRRGVSATKSKFSKMLLMICQI